MEVEYYDGDVAVDLHELASTLLGVAAGLALLFLVAIGVYYMTAQGDPNRQVRAKAALQYVIMGLLIIVSSYGILLTLDKLAKGN